MRSIAAEYGWPDYQVVERELTKVDPKSYESLAGDYKTPNSTLSISVESDRLFIKTPALGPDRMELFPESETKFFITVANMTFTFMRGDDGKVATIVVQPPKGEAVTAKRRD